MLQGTKIVEQVMTKENLQHYMEGKLRNEDLDVGA